MWERGVCVAFIPYDGGFQTASHWNLLGVFKKKYECLYSIPSHSDFTAMGCDLGIQTLKALQVILKHIKPENHCSRWFSCRSREMRQITHFWWEICTNNHTSSLFTNFLLFCSFLNHTGRILGGSVSFQTTTFILSRL